MWPLVIELPLKAIEFALLRTPIGRRWASCFRLQRLVHTLVPAVLLRLARLNQLRQDKVLLGVKGGQPFAAGRRP